MTHERQMSHNLQRVTAAIMLTVALTSGTPVQAAQYIATTSSTSQNVSDDVKINADIIVPPADVKMSKSTDNQSKNDVLKTIYVPMTSYTSAVEECDDTPFVAADGTRTYDGMIAANFLPFGTKVRIPEYFGDKVFTVHDRMNTRYSYRIDVWTEKKATAFKFGLKSNAKVEVLEMGDGKTSWNKRVSTQVAVK